MIRRGRAEGWLKLPISAFRPWAEWNGVSFNGIQIGPMPGFEQRGSTIIAERDLADGNEGPLMIVPRDLILSLESVQTFAKADQQLKEVLNSLDDFGRTARGAILVFLLMQVTISCPDISESTGVTNPLTEYIKFLPDELLPTLWTEEEQDLLVGTTLKPAVRAKLNSLLREYERFRIATKHIDWCKKHWWHGGENNDEDNEDDDLDANDRALEQGRLAFEDWMYVDAMYRSRALEFPGIGDCMVPCVDMANHSSGEATAALYETDRDGNGVLLLREGKLIKAKGEITITYGDEKGACEMIFSYGFIEDSMKSAKVIFLDLDIPHDDPLRAAKIAVTTAAPGFRIFDKGDCTGWESDFVWLVCVNEEDGLSFKLAQTIDGETELKSFWMDGDLEDTSKLRDLLQTHALWDVYQLRAVSLLQNRIEAQLQALNETDHGERNATIREIPWMLADRLRNLEMELLERAYSDLEDQKLVLLQSESVRRYLGIAGEEEDFT
ncbi:SET domain-containing protein [Lepidopterella palustris CBS 459.81]|uniref:SET domain-containing protein n=1 Tax=Lepidopterella palustris CBS 459.81 TaxID=1314670 RepID=A0A8E2JG03_9PEZI|nr:SET domain-containing protein [Lepidopterella palustris CBS 459.81]